ncbi:HAMP domain-containing histidine kinase [Clostridium sp. D2Q-11]|uniref:histidine kinase n=1 Tax=Anaeromonas frigoriresistens TaxID=2683708 RepID=A0A942Z7N2_9FIRM|nr:HAMP domain-containing sensor histidine kinase [Anaeromonas frigoriresistens]MBS4538882.1 HAMP domain-containing histidine kinase [Anaeromonas frigoriresistens]
MINHLRTRITILMIIAALISVITIGVISNITLFSKFDEYLSKEKENRIEEVINFIEESYKVDKWTEKTKDNIELSPMVEGFDLLIRDNKGDIILSKKMNKSFINDHMMGKGMGMGMMRGRNSNFENSTGDNYKVDNISLEANGENIGTLQIGYYNSLVVGSQEVEFTKGINQSILYAAIISIVVAIILGIYFSRFISKPIIDVKETTNELSKGNLDTSVKTRSKITEINQLTSSINYLKESLNSENILRKQLTSDISHELRTPLAILKSHIEAIQDGIWELNDERLLVFQKEVDRLILLVEQIKFLNNIKEHNISLNLEKLDFEKIVQEVNEGFEIEYLRKNITLVKNLEQNIYVLGDEYRLKQVIINLFSNGIKFTNNNGRIDIEIFKENDYGVFQISNTGEGISKEDLPYIFERLYRTDKSRNRDKGGSGLGLSIVKELVNAHNGQVKVNSEIGKKTVFTVYIPLYTTN